MVHGGAPYYLKVVASILPMRGGLLKILVRLLYKKKISTFFLSFFSRQSPSL